ncbi:MAG: hypothetical protein ACK52V_06415 [Betaproteobacteria bacterium]
MPKASLAQHGFNAGEWSPLLLGRQDLEKYSRALQVCKNAVLLTQGAWTRRPGTVYLHQAKHHAKKCRLFPFQFSVTQTYTLEFGENYIRFFTNRGILTQTAQNITGITRANPAVLTYSGSDTYANNDRVYVSGVGGMSQVNGREFVVTNVNTGTNTFELYDSDGNAVNSTGYDTYTSGGTVAEIYEVATTFAEADLPDIRITQSADTLYILHPDFPPQTLVRNSAVSWTLSEITFTDGPYLATNTTTTTLTPSSHTPGTGVTLTASATAGINGGQGFLVTDIGRSIRLREGSTWGWVTITGWTSSTVVTVTIHTTLTNSGGKVNWRMGLWSDTTGYPVCGTFYDDRLFMAGAATSPQRLDGSKTGLYADFTPTATDGTVADDNAVAFTLNSDDVNAIKWLAPNEKGLLVGTARGEWQVKPSTLNEAITPTNISAKPSTRHGSSDVAPVAANRAVLFVQRAGRKLREFAYLFEVDGFRAPDMTLLSEHITRPSIIELAYQEQPQAVVWAPRSDGMLLGFTYERDQDVVAWHRHELGGFSNAGATAIPLVESVAVTPSPDATRDELYLVARRYINGGTKRYIEYMSKLWEDGDQQEDAVHLDCSYTVVNGSPSVNVSGLWHLEGQSVVPYADGANHPAVTVTNGKITLNYAATIVTLGYTFQSDGQNMPLEGGAADGTAQGKTKRVNEVGFWLLDTLGLKYGPDPDNLTEILNTQWGDDFGEATPLFTGVTMERFEGDYDKLGLVYWRADGPFPATVLSILPRVKTND